MSFEVWFAFLVMDTVLCLTPGPAVLYVVSVALSRGFRSGLAAAGGVLVTNSVYYAFSGTGIVAVILASGALFTVLKTAGAVYLVGVGLRMLISRGAGAA